MALLRCLLCLDPGFVSCEVHQGRCVPLRSRRDAFASPLGLQQDKLTLDGLRPPSPAFARPLLPFGSVGEASAQLRRDESSDASQPPGSRRTRPATRVRHISACTHYPVFKEPAPSAAARRDMPAISRLGTPARTADVARPASGLPVLGCP
jgi:hypothetical protein